MIRLKPYSSGVGESRNDLFNHLPDADLPNSQSYGKGMEI
jgi:hypothetical protein